MKQPAKNTTQLLQELRRWRHAEFTRRTRALEAGADRIDWVDPGTRVSFSEVCEKARELGLEMNVVELRLAVPA